MKETQKIYVVEYKAPRCRTWELWSGPISENLKEVQKEAEKWWGENGYGSEGWKYRVVTFKRIKT